MKILKDSSLYVLGEIISKSVVFLLLPYVSRKMGVENYGELSYYETFINILLIFVLLGQDGSVSRYFYFYGKNGMNLIVKTGYAYTTATGLLLLIPCLVFELEMFAYVVISAVFRSYLSVQLSVRQCQKKAKEYTVIQLLSTLMSVVSIVFVLEFFKTDIVKYRIFGALVANMVVFFIVYVLYKKTAIQKKYTLKQYKTALMYILGFGMPLILHGLSGVLRGQIDRIFIFQYYTKADLGLYAMGANIASMLLVLIMAINKSTVPYFYEALKKNKLTLKTVHKIAVASFLVAPVPALLLYVVPENLVIWLLGKDFWGAKYYIVMFSIPAMLMVPYLVLVNYLFYYGKNHLISLSSVITTVVYVSTLLGLIKTKVEYIPYASIVGALVILPVLWVMTKYIKTTK